MNPDELLEALAECLCNTIEESSVPNVCFCGVVPGDGIVVDYAGSCSGGLQGMAWVRMTAMYPASGINVINEQVNNCGSAIGMDLEMGIVRPVETVDSRGNPPTAQQYRDAGRLLSLDSVVMLKALRCCDTLTDLDSILGTYTPAGPEGGVVGGTWPMAVLLD